MESYTGPALQESPVNSKPNVRWAAGVWLCWPQAREGRGLCSPGPGEARPCLGYAVTCAVAAVEGKNAVTLVNPEAPRKKKRKKPPTAN